MEMSDNFSFLLNRLTEISKDYNIHTPSELEVRDQQQLQPPLSQTVNQPSALPNSVYLSGQSLPTINAGSGNASAQVGVSVSNRLATMSVEEILARARHPPDAVGDEADDAVQISTLSRELFSFCEGRGEAESSSNQMPAFESLQSREDPVAVSIASCPPTMTPTSFYQEQSHYHASGAPPFAFQPINFNIPPPSLLAIPPPPVANMFPPLYFTGPLPGCDRVVPATFGTSNDPFDYSPTKSMSGASGVATKQFRSSEFDNNRLPTRETEQITSFDASGKCPQKRKNSRERKRGSSRSRKSKRTRSPSSESGSSSSDSDSEKDSDDSDSSESDQERKQPKRKKVRHIERTKFSSKRKKQKSSRRKKHKISSGSQSKDLTDPADVVSEATSPSSKPESLLQDHQQDLTETGNTVNEGALCVSQIEQKLSVVRQKKAEELTRKKQLEDHRALLRKQINELCRKQQRHQSEQNQTLIDEYEKLVQAEEQKLTAAIAQIEKYDGIERMVRPKLDYFKERLRLNEIQQRTQLADARTEGSALSATSDRNSQSLKPPVSSRVSTKSETPESATKNTSKEDEFNYEYVDTGTHWCRRCNVTLGTVSAWLKHLHTSEHQKALADCEPPWPKKKGNKNSSVDKSFVSPLKGSEFMHPMAGYYCALCHEFSGDAQTGEEHLKSHAHNLRYQEHLRKYPSYENCFNLEKGAAFARKSVAAGKPQCASKDRRTEDEGLALTLSRPDSSFAACNGNTTTSSSASATSPQSNVAGEVATGTESLSKPTKSSKFSIELKSRKKNPVITGNNPLQKAVVKPTNEASTAKATLEKAASRRMTASKTDRKGNITDPGKKPAEKVGGSSRKLGPKSSDSGRQMKCGGTHERPGTSRDLGKRRQDRNDDRKSRSSNAGRDQKRASRDKIGSRARSRSRSPAAKKASTVTASKPRPVQLTFPKLASVLPVAALTKPNLQEPLQERLDFPMTKIVNDAADILARTDALVNNSNDQFINRESANSSPQRKQKMPGERVISNVPQKSAASNSKTPSLQPQFWSDRQSTVARKRRPRKPQWIDQAAESAVAAAFRVSTCPHVISYKLLKEFDDHSSRDSALLIHKKVQAGCLQCLRYITADQILHSKFHKSAADVTAINAAKPFPNFRVLNQTFRAFLQGLKAIGWEAAFVANFAEGSPNMALLTKYDGLLNELSKNVEEDSTAVGRSFTVRVGPLACDISCCDVEKEFAPEREWHSEMFAKIGNDRIEYVKRLAAYRFFRDLLVDPRDFFKPGHIDCIELSSDKGSTFVEIQQAKFGAKGSEWAEFFIDQVLVIEGDNFSEELNDFRGHSS